MHVIDSLEFDVAMHDEERAFDEQSRLQAFLRGPALQIIDEVFDAVSPPGEVLRLDRLEVDLGPVAADDLPLLWERRLRERLLEQLQALRWRRRAEAGTGVQWQPRRQADVETLTHYLGHGHLPWHGAAAAREGLATWAEAVVHEDGAAVARFLRQVNGHHDAVHRVAQQLSLPAVQAVAQHLAGTPWPLAQWVDEAVQAALQAGAHGAEESLLRQAWQTLLGALVAGGGDATDPRRLRALLHSAAQPAPAALRAAEAAANMPVSATRRHPSVLRLQQALQAGAVSELEAAVDEALLADVGGLREVLRRQGQQARVRGLLVQGLSPRTLRRVLSSLAARGEVGADVAGHAEIDPATNAASDAVSDAVSDAGLDATSGAEHDAPAASVLWRREIAAAWRHPTQLPRKQARRQLQQHLLAWHLLDRRADDAGSLPGALDSLLQRAGQQLRIDPLALAHAFQCTLPDGRPPLRAGRSRPQPGQRSPAATADGSDGMPAHRVHAAPASPGRPARASDLRRLRALLSAWRERAGLASARARVEAALARGDVPEAEHDWPLLCEHDPDALRAALRRHGRDDARRIRLTEHLPEPMVLDVIALLVPGETVFLGGLLQEAPVFAAAGVLPVPALAPALRQFTLAYLLADRGSVFNRRSFLAQMVRQMAARQGVDSSALMAAMSQALRGQGAPSGLGCQLQQLLGELRADDTAAVAAPMPMPMPMPMTAPRLPLERTIAACGEGGIDELWQTIDESATEPLADAVRALCRTAAGRRRLAQGLPAHLLLHLALRLEPAQSVSLRRFFGSGVGAGWLATARPGDEGSSWLAAWSLWLALWSATGGRGMAWQTFFDAWLRHRARSSARLHPTPNPAPGSLAQQLQAAAAGDRYSAAAFEAALGDEVRADHWARTGTEAELMATLDRLRPGVSAGLLALWAAIAMQMGLKPGSAAWAAWHRAAWRFGLRHLFVEGRLFSAQDFTIRFAAWLRVQPGRLGLPVSAWPALEAALAVHVGAPPVTAAGRVAGVPQPLATSAARLPVQPQVLPGGRPQPRPPPPPAELAEATPVYVGNAGLVLLASYLPRLLTRVGLCDGRTFADVAAAQRAVHLVQWLADGRSHAEEHELTLNKLLCGLPLATPLPREVELSALELDTGLQMLQAVIAHWKALGQTSVEGLRTTFLQREGRLLRQGDLWRLLVEPRAFDMLLDRMPWGYATVKLPWMERVIHVDWR